MNAPRRVRKNRPLSEAALYLEYSARLLREEDTLAELPRGARLALHNLAVLLAQIVIRLCERRPTRPQLAALDRRAAEIGAIAGKVACEYRRARQVSP